MKGGQTLKTGSAQSHPDFNILLDKVPEWLAARDPYGAMIEEVASVMKYTGSGTSPLEVLVEKLQRQFEGVEVVRLNADVWSTVSRDRTVCERVRSGRHIWC
jgi:hypothetical protein